MYARLSLWSGALTVETLSVGRPRTACTGQRSVEWRALLIKESNLWWRQTTIDTNVRTCELPSNRRLMTVTDWRAATGTVEVWQLTTDGTLAGRRPLPCQSGRPSIAHCRSLPPPPNLLWSPSVVGAPESGPPKIGIRMMMTPVAAFWITQRPTIV